MDGLLKRPDFDQNLFSENAGKSYTMPAKAYFDPDFYEAEKQEIFWKSWMLVGHLCDLKEVGDYLTADICGQRIFVIRSKSGDLRGFFNVCQHRGHSLLKGSGNKRGVITCPYHAWAYDNAGDLVAAPNCENVHDFEKSDFNLPEVRVDEVAGFVFANLDPEAVPMAEFYPGMENALLGMSAKSPECVRTLNAPFDIEGNWKNACDNVLECYHCPPTHPALCSIMEMDAYTVETHENWSIQYASCRPENTAYDYADTGKQEFLTTVFMWPNLAFLTLPATEGISAFSFTPTGPETTHQDFVYYGPSADLSETETRMMKYFQEVLGPEDLRLIEDVQKGLHSLGYNQGRIMVDKSRSGISEHALHQFQNMVMTAMADHL